MLYNQKKYNTTAKLSIMMSIIVGLICSSIILIFLYDSDRLLYVIPCFILITILSYYYFMRVWIKRKKIVSKPFPDEWRQILYENVLYYQSLSDREKLQFEQKVQIFLSEKQITGINAEVDDKCRVLVASSAIIPIFSFPDWEYTELSEVLIYPDNFDDNYDFEGSGNILGMVGIGDSMILSKPALYHGFKHSNDKLNVGIHEYVHKIDEKDGTIDGVPGAMINDYKILLEWNAVVEKETALLKEDKSDLNPYALTNKAEFFAVASEYFFENPAQLDKKHSSLYHVLEKIYRQDTRSRYKQILKSMVKGNKKPKRNKPCPCGSGKKYKHCCLNK